MEAIRQSSAKAAGPQTAQDRSGLRDGHCKDAMLPSGMNDIISENTVASIDLIYTKASTFPCRVTTQAGSKYVLKLMGTGPGPMALLTEFIALKVAAAMGLQVPTATPLYLPPTFPWMMGTDEFDGAVQRSFGWNLGIEFMKGAQPATSEEVRMGDPAFLEALVAVDRALTNTDRSDRNPNVLASPNGLVAIDFDACLFLRRAIHRGTPQDSSLWADHVLQGSDLTPPQMIPVEALDVAVQDAPGEWIEMIGFDRPLLAAALHQYTAAWNSMVAPGC